MYQLLSLLLILLIVCQLPLSALAASSEEHFAPYDRASDWQGQADLENSNSLAEISARVLPTVEERDSARETKIEEFYDRTPAAVPEPQMRGADWLDGKAILQVGFSAPVDPDSALSKMQFIFDGHDTPLRLATKNDCAFFHRPDEQREPNVISVVANNLESLPADKNGTFKMLAGVKSKDGLTRSTKDAEQAIVGPYKYLQLGTPELTAVAGEAWPFQFYAPSLSDNLKYRRGDWRTINGALADKSMVVVEPPVANLKVYTYPCGLLLKGDTVAGTAYHVTFKGTLPGFGCTLGIDTKALVKVTTVPFAHLHHTGSGRTILPLPRDGNLIYPVYSFAERHLTVKVRPPMIQVEKGDYSILMEKTIDVIPSNSLQRTEIDLTPLYEKGIKSCALDLRATALTRAYDNPIFDDIQVTDLGITALQDRRAKLFFAIDRHSGTLLGNALIESIDENHVRATNGGDSAVLAVSKANQLLEQGFGQGDPCASNMSITPALTKPLIEGEETGLELQISEPGKIPTAEIINWAFTLRPADFKPAGWDSFHFGGDHRTHSMCRERSGSWAQFDLQSKPPADGRTSIAYKLTDFQNPEPIRAQINVRRDGENSKRESISVSDIVHPATLTAGVKTNIQKAEQGFDLLVSSVVCDLSGNLEEAPLTLSARAKADGRLIEQVSVSSFKGVNQSTMHVPTGEPIILTAEVTDKQGRLSRTTLSCSVEYCRGQAELQPRLGLVTDKDWYKVGDKIYLWIRSPFAHSEGVVAVSAPQTFKKTMCKFDKQSGLVELAVEPEMAGPLDIMVKLYERSAEDNVNAVKEARSTQGLLNLEVGRKPATLALNIEGETGSMKAGEKAVFNVLVKDENNQPVSDCAITLQVRRALRVAIESKVRGSEHVNNITEQSLDRLEPQTAEKTYEIYTNSLPIGPVNQCHIRNYPPIFRPVEYDENEKGIVQISRTDNQGRAKIEFALPVELSGNAIYVTADAKHAAADHLAVGTTAICLPCLAGTTTKVQTTASICTPPVAVSPTFGGLQKHGKAKVVSKKTPFTAADIASILTRLIREGQRLADSNPETVDNRSARLITLDSLSNTISFKPQCTLKKKFDAVIAADYQKVYDLNTKYMGGSHNWIEGVDDSADEPPFTKRIGLVAITTGLKDEKSIDECVRRFDTNGMLDKGTYKHQPAPSMEADEAFAFTVYGLSLVPQDGRPQEPCDYNRNNILKQLTVRDHIKTLSVQALCWLILGTQLHVREKALCTVLKAELATRKNFLASQCTAVEKALLRDTPLIKEALVLNTLAGSSDVKDKQNADKLAHDLVAALESNDVHGDHELAFITPALLKYCRTITKGPLLAKATIGPLAALRAPVFAVSQGVTVKRVFEAADGNAHLYKSADGGWHCKQGDIIRQVVTFAPSLPVEHLILHDYFAAGLKTSESVLPVANKYNNPSSRTEPLKTDAWCEHNELERNSLKAYGSDFDTRRFVYAYTLSAVIPGSYIVPPTEIRNPYDRMFFGTSAADRLIIDQ